MGFGGDWGKCGLHDLSGQCSWTEGRINTADWRALPRFLRECNNIPPKSRRNFAAPDCPESDLSVFSFYSQSTCDGNACLFAFLARKNSRVPLSPPRFSEGQSFTIRSSTTVDQPSRFHARSRRPCGLAWNEETIRTLQPRHHCDNKCYISAPNQVISLQSLLISARSGDTVSHINMCAIFALNQVHQTLQSTGRMRTDRCARQLLSYMCENILLRVGLHLTYVGTSNHTHTNTVYVIRSGNELIGDIETYRSSLNLDMIN